MKDLATGKVYLSRRTVEELGPAFARAGYDIRRMHDGTEIKTALFDVLGPEVREKIQAEMDRRAAHAAEKTTPSR